MISLKNDNPQRKSIFSVWKDAGSGRLTLFVELRDVNYPGSTYTLQYDPAVDRLVGTYFQAVQKETFLVAFTRVK